MRYLHASDPNFEPVLLDLLEHEHEVYEELTRKKGELRRGERKRDSWEVVFTELTDVLTPLQIEQLFDRLQKDFQATCEHLLELSESQKLIEPEIGGDH